MITIYGTASCGACINAINLCRKNNLTFRYKDVSFRQHYIECEQLGVDMTKIPHITVDKHYIGCYNSLKEYIWEQNAKRQDNRMV